MTQTAPKSKELKGDSGSREYQTTEWHPVEQKLHLCALLLVASAVALIMTPAAYHRIAQRGIVSRRAVGDRAGYILRSRVGIH